jgi:hypothetical protein
MFKLAHGREVFVGSQLYGIRKSESEGKFNFAVLSNAQFDDVVAWTSSDTSKELKCAGEENGLLYDYSGLLILS